MQHERKVKIKLQHGAEGGGTTGRPCCSPPGSAAEHPFQQHIPLPAGKQKGMCVQQDPVANRSCFSSAYVVYSKTGVINLEKNG